MEDIKHAGDAISICSVIATLAGLLPEIAAAASLIWTLIRIYETKTVQCLLKRRSKRGE